uniref:CSON007607 protein n=1 Tax=Culicoides sonorensis TaxID=179676 RepID=A0A336MUY5_CULSO
MEDITENECCGSGCTNCVLDRYIKTPKNKIEGCDNIFNGNYTKFKVIHIEQRTENVFEFKFEWNCDMKFEKPCILDVAGGSHLMLRASHSSSSRKFNSIFNNYRNSIVNTPKNMEYQRKFIEKHDTTEDDLYFSRPYTPILISNEPPQFTVLIKLEPFGLMSNYLQTLQIGDLTEWKGVFNKIPSNIKKAFYNIICICHGVSIAPFYTLSKELIIDDKFETNITLYACFKDIDSILLRNHMWRGVGESMVKDVVVQKN